LGQLAVLYWFAGCNALSSQPILGSPMVLYAKSLGASATVLGILAGMMPLLTITHLPAVRFVNRVGFRRFVLAGWSTRVALIFAMAAVPLTGGFLDSTTRLVVVLALLLAFNVFRGIASAAWLPWITELVPASLRGQHFARDQFFMNGGAMVAFAACAWMLGAEGSPSRFALIFLLAGLAGVVSLPLLARIPDPPPPPETDGGKGPVPWLELAAYPPFRRLLYVNVAWSLAYGGLTTFVVKYLKDGAHLDGDRILYFMSLSFLGGLAAPWLAGVRMDRLGSKPLLSLTMMLGWLIGVGWWLAAAGLVVPDWRISLPLMLLLGLIYALFSAANNRLAMHLVPAFGRNHFFALFMVVWQVTLGVSPVLWGLLLDGVGAGKFRALGVDWNRYSIYFALVALSFVGALACCRRLEEPAAADVHRLVRELLIDEPRRWWTFFTGR